MRIEFLQPSSFCVGILLSLFLWTAGCTGEDSGGVRESVPAPVEAAPIERGLIRNMRTFSGTLEASAEIVVSPKVGGRIEAIFVDVGDSVAQGATVVQLEDAEYVQALAQAEADLLVARANLAEAESALEIARRAAARSQTLRERGVASEAELDTARGTLLAREAQVDVYRAEITRAEAEVEAASIRLAYAKVTAQWRGESAPRVVAERHADEGHTVGANTPLLRIVALDPVSAIFYVTERDYGSLQVDQEITIRTDAYPERLFRGRIERIAPVFQESSRQARVEATFPNRDRLLKPGMFVRANVEVGRDADALIVPMESVVKREDQTGVFLVSPDGTTARWRPVRIGIREGNRLQLLDDSLSGRVLTLGQQLVEDGAAIRVFEREPGESQEVEGVGEEDVVE